MQYNYPIQWLEEDFLGCINHWEQYVHSINGISKKVMQKMLLSPQTLLGLKITGNSDTVYIHSCYHFLSLIISEIICGPGEIPVYFGR